MIRTSKSIILACSALAIASHGCSAPAASGADESSSQPRTDAVGQSSAAATVWTQAYVGDAHAGSVNRKSNIQAKTALVLASDGTTLYLALYFCGTGSTLSTDTKWFKGHVPLPASGNVADLGGVSLSTADGWSAYVSMTGPGTVRRADGVQYDWVASYVGDGSSAGLYRYVYPGGVDAAGTSLTGAIVGVITWNGGSQGAVILGDNSFEQVEPFKPYAGDEQVVTYPTASGPLTIGPVDPIALNQ